MAKVVKFYSSYNEPETIGSPTGTGFENVYKLKIVDGQEVLFKEEEQRNLQEEIDASKDSCDIAKIIEKYVISGDESLINQVPTQFGDFTKTPKSLIEAQNQLMEAQQSFDSLSVDVKALFNNNVYQFISDDKAMDKINDFYSKKMVNGRVDVPVQKVGDVVNNDVKSEVKSYE